MSFSFIHPFISRKVFQINFFRLIIFFLSFLFIYSSNSYGQSLSAEQIYKKVSGAVVVVHAYNDNDELAAQGSGVVLNDKGYVVTNYHVLSGNIKLKILHDKEIVPYVDIIGIDVEKDILILKIEAKKFPAVKIGDSKFLNIGQRVYAIGSPMGLENSISEGIISGLRSVEELKRNFIQITASISPGSSGGAVVNDKGELIGISTLTAKEGQNLNFAIPIEDVLKVKIGSYSKNNEYKDFELFKYGSDAYNKGDYNEAIKYYSSYLQKYPDDVGAYYNRGLAKAKLEDYKGAIQDHSMAINIDPNFASAYCDRGVSKKILEDYFGAIQDYNKAIEIDPVLVLAYFNRGVAKDCLGYYKEAIEDFNQAIILDPNDPETFSNRGVTKAKMGDNISAIQDYNKALDIDPKLTFVYHNRALSKFDLKNYIGAIQDFNKAININPNFGNAYSGRASAKYNLGDKNGACLDWSKAGELGSADAYDYIKKYCK